MTMPTTIIMNREPKTATDTRHLALELNLIQSMEEKKKKKKEKKITPCSVGQVGH